MFSTHSRTNTIIWEKENWIIAFELLQKLVSWWEKEKMQVTSIFSFSYSVLKAVFSWGSFNPLPDNKC